jgi:Rieske Fe-S protein
VGCGDGQFGAGAVTSVLPGGGVTIKVSTVPALATVGQLVKVQLPNAFIAVKRTGASTFTAISTVCTHEGTVVDIVSNAFRCSNHGAEYDNDGRVTKQPSAAGSAVNLPKYTASYDAGTDVLTIT